MSGELVEDSVTEKNSATAVDGNNYMTKLITPNRLLENDKKFFLMPDLGIK